MVLFIVKSYCIDRNIKLINFDDINKIAEEFYLFSIINTLILDSNILNNRYLLTAINYQDSLLPWHADIIILLGLF